MTSTPPSDLAAFRAHFPALERFAWLNSATMPPAARSVIAAVQRATDAWVDGTEDWLVWEADAEHARTICARWLGVSKSSVALVSTLADAAATVARGIAALARSGHERPRVVVPGVEFRSNLFPWLALADRGCDVTVIVPDADGLVRTEAVIAATRPGVSLVAVSEVQSATGHRVDVRAIAAQCRAVGARSFFNLTQSLGVLPFDAAAVGADFAATHAYKWMLAPRGATFFYVHPDRWRELTPLAPNWKNAGDLMAPGKAPTATDRVPQRMPYSEYFGADYALYDDARRVDGSLAWFSWVGARAALELLDTLSSAVVEQHAIGLASAFREGVRAHGYKVVAHEVPSQTLAVDLPTPAAAAAATQALLAADVVCAARGRRLRFGFHAYNNESDVERALGALRRAVVSG